MNNINFKAAKRAVERFSTCNLDTSKGHIVYYSTDVCVRYYERQYHVTIKSRGKNFSNQYKARIIRYLNEQELRMEKMLDE